MNAALWLLIGMQLRGLVRYFLRSLLTLRGALLTILGGTFFSLWLVSVAAAYKAKGPGDPTLVAPDGPSLLLFYCVLNVLLSSSERGIYFTPAEVNFLFPAPLGRRSLLAYKIASSVIIGLPTCLILSAVSYGYSTSFLNAFIGMSLIVMFMQIFTMALNLLAVTLGARLFSRGRTLVGVALILFAAHILWRVGGASDSGDLIRWPRKIAATTEWETLTLPLTWFFKTFSAEPVSADLAKYTALGLLVNGVLLGFVFALDAQYLEAAASTSARIYARIQRRRSGGGLTAAPPRRFRFALPLPPSFGGVGTLCWRQLTTAIRMPSRVVIVFLLFVAEVVALPAMSPPGVLGMFPVVFPGIILVLTTVLLSTLLPFDFRGDVDHLALLKTLPILPWRLALGQILAPVLIVSAMQWCALTLLYFSGVLQAGQGRGWLAQPGAFLVICGLFTLPVNGLLFGLENLLFLLFPTRILANNPADFQAIGRTVLFSLAKLCGLSGVFLLASMVGVMVGVFFPLLGLVMAWLTLAFFVSPVIPLIGWAFTIFDVGRDTPA